MIRRSILGEYKHDYSKDYLTFYVKSGGNIKWSGSTTANTLSYSKDNGKTWLTANSATTISTSVGDKIIWKGSDMHCTVSWSVGIGQFSGENTVRYEVMGNVMSLAYGDLFKEQMSMEDDVSFVKLFQGNINITSAKNMVLPLTDLTLANSYCDGMFIDCTSLTTAPSVLPATTLKRDCYNNMFKGCTSLTESPELPATVMKSSCYYNMFAGCASLVTSPELPATTLAHKCYECMFSGCTSLIAPPELPAKSCVNAASCYASMFAYCTSLTYAPTLPIATIELESSHYYYDNMFQGCTSLKYIEALFNNEPSYDFLYNWVDYVPSGGTFVMSKDANWSKEDTWCGVSSYPCKWDVITNEPDKSSYIDYTSGDTLVNNFVTPTIADISDIKHVSNEEDFINAITYFTGRTNGCKIMLDADIALTNTKSLVTTKANNNLIIDGQGHKIYPKGDVYSGETCETDDEKRCVTIYSSDNISQDTRFMTVSGDALNMSHSIIYTAESQVTNNSGGEIPDSNSGYSLECRIKLPTQIRGLEINSNDKVYINLSTWFVTETCLVTRTDSTYLYFQYDGYYHPNGDYKFASKYPTFYLINKIGNKIKSDVSIVSNKLYYPAEYNEICKAKSMTLLSLKNSANKTLIKNLIIEGGSGGQEDIEIGNSCVVFNNCEFRNKAAGYVITADIQTQLYINNCYFHDLKGGCVLATSGSTCKVENSAFNNCGTNRTNNGCIKCEGQYCIKDNTFEDYGYSAIIVGIMNISDTFTCQGVIQNNVIKQTVNYDPKMTIMDSGAIYVGTNNNSLCVIRYNKIINYDGIYNNIGIFLDDGAYNTHVYSNIIENVVNAYAISARYATGRTTPTSLTANTNKIIAQNVTDKEILIEGKTPSYNNKCYLGTNMFIKDVLDNNVTNNLQEQEKQIYSPTAKLNNGTLITNFILTNWNITTYQN